MNGIDPGAIAQNAITYFGGPAGGLILLAGLIIASIMAALHWASPHAPMNTLKFGALAWVAGFVFRQIFGWA